MHVCDEDNMAPRAGKDPSRVVGAAPSGHNGQKGTWRPLGGAKEISLIYFSISTGYLLNGQ